MHNIKDLPRRATLDHDREGFLIGKPLSTEADEATQLLAGIKDDTGRILSVLGKVALRSGQTVTPQPRARDGGAAPAFPKGGPSQLRDELGRFVARAAVAIPAPQRTAQAPTINPSAAAPAALHAVGAAHVRGAAAGSLRDELRRFVSSSAAAAPKRRVAAADQQAAQVSQAAQAVAHEVAADRHDRRIAGAHRKLEPGAAGRFAKGGGNDDRGKPSVARRAAAGVAEGTRNALSSAGQVDPAIAAANEIRGMVSGALQTVAPVARGLGALAGRSGSPEAKQEREQTGWLKRTWRELRGLRTDEAAANKALLRTVKDRRPGGASDPGSGILGMLMAVLGPLMALPGLLPKLLGGLGGGAVGGLGRGLAAGAGGLLKRWPVLGALLSGGLGIFNDREIANDPNLTPEEKRSKRAANAARTTGSIGGALLGVALGSMLLPGIGTAVGGTVGGWLGGKGGEMLARPLEGVLTWFQGLDLQASWDGAMATLRETWSSATSRLGEWLSSLPGADLIRSGIEKVRSIAAPAVDVVKEKASSIWNALTNGAGAALSAAQEKVAPVVAAVKDKASAFGAQAKAGYDVARGVAGAAAAPEPVGLLQSGARAAGKVAGGMANAAMLAREAVASGISDPKKLAMFMGQMSHESGGFTKLQENLNYSSVGRIRQVFGKNKAVAGMNDEQLKGLVSNPDALANVVYGGRMGNTDPGDGAKFKGRGFVQLTGKDNYAAAGKALGLDLVNHPELAADPANASKIAAWYWKTRVAAKGADTSVDAATKAINGGTHGLEDRRQQTQKFAAMIDSGTLPVGGGAAAAPARTQAEAGGPSPVAKAPAVAAPVVPAVAPLPTAQGVAAAAARPLPAVAPPRLPAVAPAPEITQTVQLNTPAPQRTEASALAQPPGRDLPERRIAHIATGGLGGAWRH